MSSALTNLAYLLASVMFVWGIKDLSHPRTAVRGNLVGAVGMLLAIVVTLLDQHILGYTWIFAGIVVGSGIGAVLAQRTPMTAMPQMVAVLNGFGGGASALVAGAALIEVFVPQTSPNAVFQANPNQEFLISTVASGFVGAITFTGSMIAFAKLQELLSGRSIVFHGQQILNAALAVVSIFIGVLICLNPEQTWLYWLLVLVSSVLGVLLVIPIGGADMPVVISLLNSYSGIAAAATGFVLQNNVLIIAGALVGASGIILTRIMCKAMNRSLFNVIFGVMEAGGFAAKEDEIYAGKVKSTSAEEVAMLLETARRVVIVPGYGLAVSQAQHAIRDLTQLIEARDTVVEFAIHPVAGRMPGHMNVLLAEADIPYDKMKEMDEINPSFQQTDVVIVVGANDVVNPLARTDPKSPIAGMPILNVDQAHTVVVIKRSLSSGFAGIPNPLFAMDNTLMLFGDAKKALQGLIAALKEAA